MKFGGLLDQVAAKYSGSEWPFARVEVLLLQWLGRGWLFCVFAEVLSSVDYDLEYSSAAFNRLRISISALNGAIFKVVDLKLAERSSVKALVNLN